MCLDFNGVRKIWQFEQSPSKRDEQQWKEIVPEANKLSIGVSLELLLLSENFRLCEEFKYVSERCLYLKKTSVSSEKSKQWAVVHKNNHKKWVKVSHSFDASVF